jgi:hypothetical protein
VLNRIAEINHKAAEKRAAQRKLTEDLLLPGTMAGPDKFSVTGGDKGIIGGAMYVSPSLISDLRSMPTKKHPVTPEEWEAHYTLQAKAMTATLGDMPEPTSSLLGRAAKIIDRWRAL